MLADAASAKKDVLNNGFFAEKKILFFYAKEIKNTLCALLDRFQKRLNFLPAYFKGKYI